MHCMEMNTRYREFRMEIGYSAAMKIESGKAELTDFRTCFSDFVAMRTLAAKRLELFGNPRGANANTAGFGHLKELVRNVGLRVDAIRLAELDAVTELFACNKQEFFMELLVAGLDQAKDSIREAGLEKRYEALVDQRIAAAGITVGPSPNKGHLSLYFRGEPIVSPLFADETAPVAADEVAPT